MIFAIFLLVIIAGLWALFVEGWLFKIILFFAGWFGLFVGLKAYVPESASIAIKFDGGASMSWAAVIATGVCVMALLCTRVKN